MTWKIGYIRRDRISFVISSQLKVRMEYTFICGESASRHIMDISDDWNKFETDILILHGPGEEDVGRFLGQQIDEIWIKSLQERREFRRLNEGTIVKGADKWRTIEKDVICDNCGKDALPEKLKMISLDVVHLHHCETLEALRHLFQRKFFIVAFALTNKMLMYPELLQRVKYLKGENDRHFLALPGENRFRVFLTEPLKFDNFLFNEDKAIKLFSKSHAGGTLYGKPHLGCMFMFKKCMSIVFSGKNSSKKYLCKCPVNREESGFDITP